MGLLEPITHKEEIESLLNEAQSMYDNAKISLSHRRNRQLSVWRILEKLKLMLGRKEWILL